MSSVGTPQFQIASCSVSFPHCAENESYDQHQSDWNREPEECDRLEEANDHLDNELRCLINSKTRQEVLDLHEDYDVIHVPSYANNRTENLSEANSYQSIHPRAVSTDCVQPICTVVEQYARLKILLKDPL